MSGKEIRLKRLFKHSPRLFLVPLDHGITIGPVSGLEDVRRAAGAALAGGADGIVIHKGLAERIAEFLGPNGLELVIHLSASTVLAPDPNRKELVTSVESAIRAGATAVSTHVNLGTGYEAEMLRDMGRIAEECAAWGMPLMAMMYVRDGKKASEYDPAKIKHAARVAEELGADLIKVNYTGSPETFHEVVEAVRAPVLVAGGPKMESPSDLLAMVEDAVGAGAKGVAIGRNVFQDPNPTLLASAIRQVLDRAPEMKTRRARSPVGSRGRWGSGNPR